MSGNGFTRGMTGRADLVRARRLGDPELEEYIAGLLGYRFVAPEPPPIKSETREEKSVDASPAAPVPTSAVVARDIPFWQAVSFEVFHTAESGGSTGEEAAQENASSKEKPGRQPVDLAFLPLSSNASLLTRLRAATPTKAIRGEIDVDRIVEEWGRGRFLATMPRSSRKVWGRSVQVLVDRSRRLIPYWEDQTRACLALRDIYPPEGYSRVVLPEGRFEPSSMEIDRQVVDYQPPPPGSAVVALSDLGALDRRGPALMALWAERGRRLSDLELTPLAIVPLRQAALPEELTQSWTILPWETSADPDAPALSGQETEALVRQILTLLSFTLRIEPQLIRFVRRLLAAGRGEPGIESRVWQHEAFADPHCEAAELSRDQVDSLRAALPSQRRELRKRIYERVEASHNKIYEGVWYAEMGNLGADELITDDERRAMCEWFESLENSLKTKTRPDEIDSLAAWHREVSERLLEAAYQDRGRLGKVLHRLWALVHRDDPDALLPNGADLRFLPQDTERRVELRQLGDRLIVSETRRDGTPLALLRTFQSRLKIEPFDDFWDGGAPPQWDESWGRDKIGSWVELRVGKVTQRLRWIPPGTFMMGSPEHEEGRYPDEGPRHEETITQGFWMFDTPCTQALWEAVMGENPSQFKGLDRPVESVSWDQCQEFIKKLNERCAGLQLSLPTEAQWEYACRAGTNTATYAGPMKIKGANNAPILHEIAWYGGNSGIDFELTNGVDASGWPEKQFAFDKAGTHPVAKKKANPWGLYDTLGNVYEWCEDAWTDDYSEKSRAAASARRVIRGGSWYYGTQVVRAAYRDLIVPSFRGSYLGFRCAEFRSKWPAGRQGGAERAGERGAGGAEPPGDRDPASGAGWINVDAPELSAVSFATLTPVRVSSDVEQIVLRTTTRPEWASAIGRDRHGLWAEFTIEREAAKPPKKGWRWNPKVQPPTKLAPVRQRLRWIPPGRFLMGSPKDEEWRYDWEQLPHEVAIDEGFWMFDTPCTQALWEVLMGENPSQFKSPDRPVEQVSWDDCGKFFEEIKKKVGLTLALPSEAQWEYACRAGTTTSTYAGQLEIKGANNAPILDAIAWYGGNSGVDFELSNGYDASDWPEKQFAFDKAGTHPVARKKANPWGLFDMLGNVWEWCDDTWVSGDAKKSEASALRVFRGGSWFYDSRLVRAAYRILFGPSLRNSLLGFRCAEFRSGRELSQQSGASQGSAAQGAEHPGDRDLASGAPRPGHADGLSARPN